MPDEPAMTWDEAYSLLTNLGKDSGNEAISQAITRLGKPFDQQQVRRAAPLVSRYLRHENHVVRYQAIWFLGSWGRLHEYLTSIIQSAQSDADIDNRAFAARCAGLVLMSHRDVEALNALLSMAIDEEEQPDVRSGAYSSLLFAFYGESAREQAHAFSPVGGKSVADFDLAWLSSLPKWIEQLHRNAS